MTKDEVVTISKQEYDQLVKDSIWLSCLESAGVDNWDGFDMAQDIYDEHYGKG